MVEFLLPLLTESLLSNRRDRIEAETTLKERHESYQRRKSDYDEACKEYKEAHSRLETALADAKKEGVQQSVIDSITSGDIEMEDMPDLSPEAGETSINTFKRIINTYVEQNYSALKEAIAKDVQQNTALKESLAEVKKRYGVEDGEKMAMMYPIVPDKFKDDMTRLGINVPFEG